MSEKMSAEEMAKQYSLEYSSAGMNWENIQKAFLAGDSNGYSRGKAEAEKMIWELLEEYWKENGSRETIEIFPQHLKLLVFGGGVDDNGK
jgi:hypothetical protein